MEPAVRLALDHLATSRVPDAKRRCTASSRLIVTEGIHDRFIAATIERMKKLVVDDALKPGTEVGPVVDDKQLGKNLEYVEIGRKEGAKLAYGGERLKRETDGYYMSPAIFTETSATMRINREEIFGPVLAVMKAASFEEALRLANATDYGLTGGVYSRSPANLDLARRHFDVGNLYLNRPITGALVGRQPFGGHRLSGIGAKAGGEDYLLQFVVVRIVSEQTLRRGFAPTE